MKKGLVTLCVADVRHCCSSACDYHTVSCPELGSSPSILYTSMASRCDPPQSHSILAHILFHVLSYRYRGHSLMQAKTEREGKGEEKKEKARESAQLA